MDATDITAILLGACFFLTVAGVTHQMRKRKPLRTTIWAKRSDAMAWAEDSSRQDRFHHAVRYRKTDSPNFGAWAVDVYTSAPAGPFAAVFHRGINT